MFKIKFHSSLKCNRASRLWCPRSEHCDLFMFFSSSKVHFGRREVLLRPMLEFQPIPKCISWNSGSLGWKMWEARTPKSLRPNSIWISFSKYLNDMRWSHQLMPLTSRDKILCLPQIFILWSVQRNRAWTYCWRDVKTCNEKRSELWDYVIFWCLESFGWSWNAVTWRIYLSL